ncbi:hypothetical protein FACS1894181_09730 [Bacteroidia bacterium]|nr:hypothetical protein FACS1894181_09730 [Bacteroidia bacterium]
MGSLLCLGLVIVLTGVKRFRDWNFPILSYIRMFVIFLAVWIGGVAVSTDLNREKIIEMATEAYYNHWDKVLDIAGKTKLANPISTYYTNIALSKQLQLGERMMEFYQPFSSGLFLPANPESDWFTIFSGSDVYYHIGDMNMAQHAAMLGMIFSPYQRSSRLIQRLIEVNMVNGDIPAAMKYIRMLESTLFHRKKAALFKEMALTHPAGDYPWLQNKREMVYKDDILRNSNNPQASLELLVKNSPANHAALDYLLCFYLLNKDIPAFFNAYTLYCKGKSNYIPKVYAEALLIYFAATGNVTGKMQDYHINPDIIKAFNEYTRLYEDTNGNLEPVRDKFPHTYWLYYHFATTGK